VQLRSDERQKKVNGIGKTVIEEMEGAKRE
jgi:hypothetical protein